MSDKKNETDWAAVKNQIKSKFPKLSEKDVDGLNGHMDLLVSKVQKAYAYDKTKAEKECKTFKETLNK